VAVEHVIKTFGADMVAAIWNVSDAQTLLASVVVQTNWTFVLVWMVVLLGGMIADEGCRVHGV
jgi:hypothetical protein